MYRHEAEELVASGERPSSINGLPPMLHPLADEIEVRTVLMIEGLADHPDQPFIHSVVRRLVVEEIIGRIEFDDFLDEHAFTEE